MFTVAVGAAVQGLLVALAARGVGSLLDRLDHLLPDVVRTVLDLPPDWGTVRPAIGYAEKPPEFPGSRRNPAIFWSADEPALLRGRRPERLDRP